MAKDACSLAIWFVTGTEKPSDFVGYLLNYFQFIGNNAV